MQKIKSIQPLGVMDVWDIEVEDDHSYCAHGVVNHNSSRSPNGQNIPSRDTLEFRACFIPLDSDHVLVDVDYGSQEPRIAAEFTQDPNLIAIFHSGKDIYVEVARIAFGEIIEKKDPRRKKMKDLTLASFYGKTKWGLSKDLEISLEEAEEMLVKFHVAFPLVDQNYVQVKYKQAKTYGYVTTLSGAKLWVNLYNRQWKNNAVNSPIQGTAAEMLKRSVYETTVDWCGENFYTDIPFILPVHDESLSEYKKEDAQKALERASKVMLEVATRFHPSVPAAVEAKICETWADAK